MRFSTIFSNCFVFRYARNLIDHTIRRNATPDLDDLAEIPTPAGVVHVGQKDEGSDRSSATRDSVSRSDSRSSDSGRRSSPGADASGDSGVASEYVYNIDVNGTTVKVASLDSKLAKVSVKLVSVSSHDVTSVKICHRRYFFALNVL